MEVRMEEQRLVGVRVFGWILIGFGIIVLATILFTKLFGSAEDMQEIWGSFPLSSFLLRSFVCIFEGYFLLKLKNWARLYGLIVSWMYLLWSLFLFAGGSSIITTSMWLIFCLAYICYFLRPTVKDQFEEGSNDVMWAIGLTILFFVLDYIGFSRAIAPTLR